MLIMKLLWSDFFCYCEVFVKFVVKVLTLQIEPFEESFLCLPSKMKNFMYCV